MAEPNRDMLRRQMLEVVENQIRDKDRFVAGLRGLPELPE